MHRSLVALMFDGIPTIPSEITDTSSLLDTHTSVWQLFRFVPSETLICLYFSDVNIQ